MIVAIAIIASVISSGAVTNFVLDSDGQWRKMANHPVTTLVQVGLNGANSAPYFFGNKLCPITDIPSDANGISDLDRECCDTGLKSPVSGTPSCSKIRNFYSPYKQSSELPLKSRTSPDNFSFWASYMARSRKDRVEAILSYLETAELRSVQTGQAWDADEYRVSWKTLHRAFYGKDQQAWETAFREYYGLAWSKALELWRGRDKDLWHDTRPNIPYAPSAYQLQLPFGFAPYLVEKKTPQRVEIVREKASGE